MIVLLAALWILLIFGALAEVMMWRSHIKAYRANVELGKAIDAERETLIELHTVLIQQEMNLDRKKREAAQ